VSAVITNEAMWKLVNAQDWVAVEKCVADGKWDANQPLTLNLQKGGLLLLSAAAEHGLVSLVKQLIKNGADVNKKLTGEDSPLMSACEAGHGEIVDLLIEAGADVNKKSSISDDGDPGETPFMIAAEDGDRNMLAKLLKHGADVKAKTRRGRTALSFAIFKDKIDPDLIRFLLNAGCPVDGRDLHHPIYRRELDIVELLLAAKPDVNLCYDWPTRVLSNAKGDTPLFVVVVKNVAEMAATEKEMKPKERLVILDLLISAGADVNAQRGGRAGGWTPLMYAVAQDEVEVARRLLDAGADPNKTIETRWIGMVDGCQKQRKGPLSAIGMANERTDNQGIRKLLLGLG
jgi:ankyrin repeat protein